MIYKFEKEEYKVMFYKDYCSYNPSVEPEPILSSTPFFFNVDKHHSEFEFLHTEYGEDIYVKNYGNLFAQCELNHLKITITKSDDKLKIVTKLFNKCRNVGKRPFRKLTRIMYLTYDLKYHNLYFGSISDYHKKDKKSFSGYKNNWFQKPLKTFLECTKSYLKAFKTNNFEVMENDGVELAKCLDIYLDNIPGAYDAKLYKEDVLYKKFLDSNKIKLPNNWNNFSRSFPQVTKKLYKKNKYKFVDAYMELHKLKGDKIKRVLHIVESTDGINYLKFALNFFGDDFILSQPDEFIQSVIESKSYSGVIPPDTLNETSDGYTKNERNNAFELFKLVLNNKINFMSYIDHIHYREQMKTFEPKLWKSKNYFDFMNEHYEWSEKVANFNRKEYTRYYNDEFKSIMEQPIGDYYPILLSTTKEYNFESITQSNCVRNYDSKPDSIIFSVRHNDYESGERATIEYRIINVDGVFKLNRVQSLGKHNKQLESEWNSVLKVLDDRVMFCLDNEIFKLPMVDIKDKNKVITTKIVVDNTTPQIENKPIYKRLIFENTPDGVFHFNNELNFFA
jgi:hypothetical protein